MYYGTPPIVTNGLVLNLDAQSPQSIPVDPTVNLARWSQDFSQSVWGKSIYDTITTGSIAPDGTPTAALIDETSASLAPATFSQGSIIATSSTITYSVYTKKGTATSRSFLLRNGTTSTNFTGLTFSYNISSTAPGWTVQDVGDGWFRLSYKQTTGITPGDSLVIYAGRTGAAAAGSTQTWYLWGAQAEATSYATPYIISTATNGRRTTWQDLSGNNNIATLRSSSILGSIPVFPAANNRVLDFNGTSSYASISPISFNPVGTSDFTISAWIKLNAKPITNPRIVSLGSDANNYFNLGTYGGGSPGNHDCFWFEVKKAGTFYGGFYFTGRKYEINTWYHVLGTFDNSTNTAKFYINGITVSGTSVIGGTPNVYNTMLIGTLITNPTEVINGSISQIQMYNRVLSQSEITQNYNALKSRFGLQ
jgi:hypothetical protein